MSCNKLFQNYDRLHGLVESYFLHFTNWVSFTKLNFAFLKTYFGIYFKGHKVVCKDFCIFVWSLALSLRRRRMR